MILTSPQPESRKIQEVAILFWVRCPLFGTTPASLGPDFLRTLFSAFLVAVKLQPFAVPRDHG
jgi:hypothetical protein